MTDLRQGVTSSQHEVLDLLEQSVFGDWPMRLHLRLAGERAHCAAHEPDPQLSRAHAIEAATRLLHAIAQLDAQIEARIATAPDGDDNA
jgi:hypothetical protein